MTPPEAGAAGGADSGTARAPRRAMLIALAECVLGAALVLMAASRPWVRAMAEQGDLRVELETKGSSLAAEVPALGLVGLAGALALVAARGWGRRAVGVLILAAGAGAALGAASNSRVGSSDLQDEAGAALGTEAASVLAVEHTVWPWLALFGALLVAVAGASAAWRGGTWPSMSARYEKPVSGDTTPTRERTSEGDAPLEQWRAMDRGEDPTLR